MSERLLDDIFRNMHIEFYRKPQRSKSIIEDDLGFHIEIKYNHKDKYYMVEYSINSHSRTQIAEMILEMIQMEKEGASNDGQTEN